MLDSLEHDSFEKTRKTLFRTCFGISLFLFLEVNLSDLSLFGVKPGIDNKTFAILCGLVIGYLSYIFSLQAQPRLIKTQSSLSDMRHIAAQAIAGNNAEKERERLLNLPQQDREFKSFDHLRGEAYSTIVKLKNHQLLKTCIENDLLAEDDWTRYQSAIIESRLFWWTQVYTIIPVWLASIFLISKAIFAD